VDAAHQDQILVSETRAELKNSFVAWIALSAVTAFLGFVFRDVARGPGFDLWLAAMALFLAGWLAAWINFALRPPDDESILERWIPGAKAGMTFCNVATAGSVWVFLPASDPDQRALMIVLYAWYLIIQFAAATEATQMLRSAVLLVLGSLTAWLVTARPPYFIPLATFLPLFGATLVAIRRFVRETVVKSTIAQAAAEAARCQLDAALTIVARERDAKTQFIRAASHDLQQPLQAAALFLDRVRPGGRAAEQAPPLGGLRQALTTARSLVAAMLEHLKLEGGVIRPAIATIVAGELFDRVLLTQGPAAAAGGIRISTAGWRVAMDVDASLLTRAVENLVANAIRHSGGQRVLIGARRREDAVWIWVIDDGRGLGDGDEARIFSPFEQGSHVGDAGGFGLGLASTRGLVSLMGGSCGLRRNGLRGAAFYIRLPAARASDGGEGMLCAA
jgi:signal transduction histidine kinase